tara:strand:+ start:722 stop:1633 length:912 start_codon:yes stop_codon:yes gene_type:complete
MKLEFGTGSAFARLSETKAYFLVNYALDLGINRFDTGVNYGNWKTQPLLGLVLKEHIKRNREKLIISSKAGTLKNGYKNFTPDYIEDMVNKSISDMQCKYLDKFYLHGPTLRELETKGLLKKLISLVKKGKIKRFGVNTHKLLDMKKISTGIYEEMSLLLIDYNLLQQDRGIIFDNCRKNNIEIGGGNSLCQGSLLQSPLGSFFRNRNLFYLLRFILKKSSKRFLNPAKNYRTFAKTNFPKEYKNIPLSFVLHNSSIKTIPIGMLSKSSIEKNINIAKNITSKETTTKVGDWCLLNCQIFDSH